MEERKYRAGPNHHFMTLLPLLEPQKVASEGADTRGGSSADLGYNWWLSPSRLPFDRRRPLCCTLTSDNEAFFSFTKQLRTEKTRSLLLGPFAARPREDCDTSNTLGVHEKFTKCRTAASLVTDSHVHHVQKHFNPLFAAL